ncbi:ABC transporter ATP-binding protein [Sinorhizobium meliloti]|uniref:ABC transporter ATP-binding protein n=1 Tax=Rhizobium meliloti TaxID=382 RepID=UPI000FDC313D|nr:ABC transporter ATP-binding protein [Sinorhizobium meliloti]RVL26944.1 ABC transporter ATP-binding protein [Sinorhizobium meliloti]
MLMHNTVAEDTLLDVRELETHFYGEESVTRALGGISFQVKRGETLGVVGESGCGKSVTALSILRLLPKLTARTVGGEVRFQGRDLLELSEREMRKIRGDKIAMIFQDPMTSLNPVYTVGHQIAEAVQIHTGASRSIAMAKAEEMLRFVRIADPERRVNNYPYEMSGGMRQRVIVMYAGRIVEQATVTELFARPMHPYTQALMRSVPDRRQGRQLRLPEIPGIVPSLREPIIGCSFAPRCRFAIDICREKTPVLIDVESGHAAACWRSEEIVGA